MTRERIKSVSAKLREPIVAGPLNCGTSSYDIVSVTISLSLESAIFLISGLGCENAKPSKTRNFLTC